MCSRGIALGVRVRFSLTFHLARDFICLSDFETCLRVDENRLLKPGQLDVGIGDTFVLGIDGSLVFSEGVGAHDDLPAEPM